MTSTPAPSETPTGTARASTSDLKFEAVVIPVADVDRAKEFYASLGWRQDADFPFDNGFRIVQFTPPGSGSSVQFGTNITTAAPGSAQGLYLIVSDIEAARDELAARGAEVSEVFHPGAGRAVPARRRPVASAGPPPTAPATSPSPRSATRTATAGCCRRSPPAARPHRRGRDDIRLHGGPGDAMRRAAAAHGEHEKRTGEYDEDWPDWYAAYMVAEQAGTELPT